MAVDTLFMKTLHFFSIFDVIFGPCDRQILTVADLSLRLLALSFMRASRMHSLHELYILALIIKNFDIGAQCV